MTNERLNKEMLYQVLMKLKREPSGAYTKDILTAPCLVRSPTN